MKKGLILIIFLLGFAGIGFCADPSSVAGTYLNKDDNKQYLVLHADGTFALKQRTQPPDPMNPFTEISGKFLINGEDLTLNTSDGGQASGKMKDNTFEDSDGKVWVKEGSEAPSKLERPKRQKLKL